VASALLIVGAQAGFIDGPRVLANMAHDAWIPRRFASLSGRLTTRNGILLMGGAALAALLYTRGNVSLLVLMYSINVFLTFSLSMAGMLRAELFPGEGQRRRPGRILLFAVGLLLCATILVVSSVEKFLEGGWLTLAVTSLFAGLCFLIHAHYRSVGRRVAKLEQDVSGLEVPEERRRARLDPNQRTAGLPQGAILPPLAAQRDGERAPEAPAVPGPHDGRPADRCECVAAARMTVWTGSLSAARCSSEQ
jgi:amino acid permease